MKQIRNFLIVGSINTIFSYTFYSVFLYIGFNYWLSALFSTIIGVFFSFKTLERFVFHSNNKSIYKFISVYSLIYLLNITLIKFFNGIPYNYYVAGFFAIVICAAVSFFLNKYFVFINIKTKLHSINSNEH
jgi:putative flippase GtrA